MRVNLTYTSRVVADRIVKAPDVGVGEDVAHFYFLQLLSGLVTSNTYRPRTAKRLLTFHWKRCSGLYSFRGRVPSRPQARKHSPGCGRDTQDIRLWSLLGVQAQGVGPDTNAHRKMRQSTIRRTRSVFLYPFCYLLIPDSRVQLNTDKPYAAEPIDAWGIGVILFTMVAGSA